MLSHPVVKLCARCSIPSNRSPNCTRSTQPTMGTMGPGSDMRVDGRATAEPIASDWHPQTPTWARAGAPGARRWRSCPCSAVSMSWSDSGCHPSPEVVPSLDEGVDINKKLPNMVAVWTLVHVQVPTCPSMATRGSSSPQLV